MKKAELVRVSDKSFTTLISAEKINERVRELADQINRDYAGKSPVLICVLKGATLFMSDLVRNLSIECSITFMKVSSYHGGTASTGKVQRDMQLNENLEGKDVIIVEDIVDTGNTAVFLFSEIGKMKPASVSMATLLFKPAALKHSFKPDYVAFEIGNQFVVGYGLDYNELGRNLPEIYVLANQS
jgi:hypoxanthine phosphoribosyltransferase